MMIEAARRARLLSRRCNLARRSWRIFALANLKFSSRRDCCEIVRRVRNRLSDRAQDEKMPWRDFARCKPSEVGFAGREASGQTLTGDRNPLQLAVITPDVSY
jgi:hypothetical protein